MADQKRVAAAYLFANGMVMAFNDDGEQIPSLQGQKDHVWPSLQAAIDEDTVLHGFNGRPCEWRCGAIREGATNG